MTRESICARGYLVMKSLLLVLWSVLVLSTFAVAKIDLMAPFKAWEEHRQEFLKGLRPVQLCYTEDKAVEIMKVINSRQCSIVGLPLNDAIQIEYDNWLSEDWFPDDQELEEMRLDEIM